jgi:hypothetical protein
LLTTLPGVLVPLWLPLELLEPPLPMVPVFDVDVQPLEVV